MARKGKVGNVLSKVFGFFFFGYLGIMILGGAFGAITSLFGSDDENLSLADGFTISKYNVVLDVKEDNKIDVTENITVNWTSKYHHGIYKFTPEWAKYTDKNGNTIKRKSIITDLRSTSDPYTTDWVKKKARIKIGDPKEYVDLGEKTYVIKYKYDMGSDPYKKFDEFIYHAFGDYWGTEIKNAEIQINMPKSIEGYNVNFFTDKNRIDNVTDYVDYEVVGSTLNAKFNQEKYTNAQKEKYCSNKSNIVNGICDFDEDSYFNKKLKKSLTVDIELPEGYFAKGSWNYGWGSFIITLIIFAITAFTIYKWKKYGKNYPKPAQTVEFYPPKSMSSAEVGYVYGKQPSKKLTISLIVQLASKGYIKIDEIKDKKKQIQITNLAPTRPLELSSFDSTLPKRLIEVKKLKDADDHLTKKETTMMKYLFKKEDTKSLDTNIEKFNAVKDGLVSKGYIKVLSDNELDRLSDIETKRKEYDEKVKEYQKIMLEYHEKMGKMPSLTDLERIVYDRLFEKEDIVILSEHKTFYKAFDDVEKSLKSKLKDTIHDKIATKKMISSIITTIIVALLSLISYKFVEDLSPSWNILYTLSFICIVINAFFTIFMKRKTEYGEQITSQIEGFRNFLITAEKPKLEALVEEDPNYFYNILPYTYALSVSKKWIKKFEDIPMPEMDMGNFDYSSDWAYNDLYSNVYRPEPVYTGSNSSGCSSCGGGCSSCGGGCSSCGGGGSW